MLEVRRPPTRMVWVARISTVIPFLGHVRLGDGRTRMTADRISVGELQEVLAAGQRVTVVDVRSPSEVDWGIPGSIQVDAYGDLQSGRLGPLAELNLAPRPVVTVCGGGRTAAIATELLRATGVEALTLDGGMRAW